MDRPLLRIPAAHIALIAVIDIAIVVVTVAAARIVLWMVLS